MGVGQSAVEAPLGSAPALPSPAPADACDSVPCPPRARHPPRSPAASEVSPTSPRPAASLPCAAVRSPAPSTSGTRSRSGGRAFLRAVMSAASPRALRAARRLFADAPDSSGARGAVGRARNQQRARRAAPRARSPDRRAPDASCRSGRPARCPLIASVRVRAAAGLSGRAPAGLPGRAGREAPRPRLREGARRREELAQPGETWSPERRQLEREPASGSRGRERGRGARGGGSQSREERRGAQKTGCRRTRSRCRGGWTQPSLPAERGPSLSRAAQAAGLRAGSAPRCAPLAPCAAAGGRRLVGRPRHTHPGRGNSGELEGPAAPGWPPSPDLCLVLTTETERTLPNLAKPRGRKGGRPKP